jgi:hypothetical protein
MTAAAGCSTGRGCDGSDHRWSEDRDHLCTLIVAVEEATGAIQEMRFVLSERTFACFEMLAGYLRSHGKAMAFYSDKHSVFQVARSHAKSDQRLAFSHERKRIIPEQAEVTCGIVGK